MIQVSQSKNAQETARLLTHATRRTQGTLKANIETGDTGLTAGDSTPFSDSSGTLTLQNIDVIDNTTEATLEAAIDIDTKEDQKKFLSINSIL